MEVIVAPQQLPNIMGPTVFLAGGITECPNWQIPLIEMFRDVPNLTLLNPRRENFPIDDPAATEEQITWEFRAIQSASIFSIWFSACESVHPICLYELGRNLVLKDTDNIIIGIEPGYLRQPDVEIQVGLVAQDLAGRISYTLEDHANRIYEVVNRWSPPILAYEL